MTFPSVSSLSGSSNNISEVSLNSAENEIPYIIVTATERGDRGECHIEFPSRTFQNPEEGGNKPPKLQFMNKKIV